MNVYLFYVSNNRLWRYFPNSVLALANPLLRAGFQPVIIDTALQDWRQIPLVDPLLVGFSVYTDSNISVAIQIAQEIRKRYPYLKFVWGGPHVIMLPRQTIVHPLVDFACYGEGEISIAELAKALEKNQTEFYNISGILWKDKFGKIIENNLVPFVNIDDIELHPYHLLNENLYTLKHGKMYYECSRGCPYGCKFCSYDHKKWRFRSFMKVITDLTAIEDRFSPQEIQVIDANHFINIDWVKEIWTNKIRRGLKFKWETNCRFDILVEMEDTTLKILTESGCYQLRLGAESGSQKILDYLDKGIKVEQIIAGIERCRKYNINPVVSFMMGYPPEGKKELQATIRLIDTLRERFPGIHINGLFQFQPYPNTKIFKEISKEYTIPQPESLDGWAEYQIIEFHRTDFPWVGKEKFRIYTVLNSIVSYIFFSDKLREMPYEQRKNIFLFRFNLFFRLFKVIDYLIRIIFVNLRWKKRVMIFPAEWYFWNFLREKVLKLF